MRSAGRVTSTMNIQPPPRSFVQAEPFQRASSRVEVQPLEFNLEFNEFKNFTSYAEAHPIPRASKVKEAQMVSSRVEVQSMSRNMEFNELGNYSNNAQPMPRGMGISQAQEAQKVSSRVEVQQVARSSEVPELNNYFSRVANDMD